MLTIHGNAQDIKWSKNYGGSGLDIISDIIKGNDDVYYAVGNTSSSDYDLSSNYGSFDGWVLCFNPEGDILWSKNYGGSRNDIFLDLHLVSDGLLLFGHSNSTDYDLAQKVGAMDVWVMKIDFQGHVLWSKSFGSPLNDFFSKAIVEEDETIAIHAYSSDKGGNVPRHLGSFDLWFFRLDASGNILQSKVFGGSDDDTTIESTPNQSGSLRKSGDGYLIITGSKSKNGDLVSNNGDFDNWILALDEEGNRVSTNNFGSGNRDYLLNGVFNKSDSFYIGNSYAIGDQSDVIVYKKMSDSFSVYTELGGTSSDQLTTIRKAPDRSVFGVGTTSSSDGDLRFNYGLLDGWLFRLDENMNVAWSRNFGGSKSDLFLNFVAMQNHDILAVGYTGSDNIDLQNNYGEVDGWIMYFDDTCIDKKTIVDTTICSSSYLIFGRDTIRKAGRYMDYFPTSDICDSIIIWDVAVEGESIATRIWQRFCVSYLLPSGKRITETGIYLDTLRSDRGCDSIVEFRLNKKFFVRDSVFITACEHYDVADGPRIFNSSIFQDTVWQEAGCDSIRTYLIQITPPDSARRILQKEEGESLAFKDILIDEPGIYQYRQQNENACDSIYILVVSNRIDCKFYIPNIFTPNNDGINDVFYASHPNECNLLHFKAQIYDRWGQLITESQNHEEIWDGGTYSDGVYVYRITYGYQGRQGIEFQEVQGTLSLLR